MGQVLDCFCSGIEFTRGQKKSSPILTTSVNKDLELLGQPWNMFDIPVKLVASCQPAVTHYEHKLWDFWIRHNVTKLTKQGSNNVVNELCWNSLATSLMISSKSKTRVLLTLKHVDNMLAVCLPQVVRFLRPYRLFLRESTSRRVT